MKKALVYASVASMIQQFNMNNIKLLQELGYKVDVACNFEFGSTITEESINKLKSTLVNMNVDFYNIPISRKISDIKNLKQAYRITLKLLNKKNYDLIHCHSPIGGMICRVANKNSNNYENCKMIYTAHGFHFFKGNNLIKNFIFRNIEKYAAKYTDILITINQEDYNAAKKFKYKNGGKTEYVPGVGINLDKINSAQSIRKQLCEELNISPDNILVLSVGELSVRKNQEIIIKTLPQLANNIHYIICGKGDLKNHLSTLAKNLYVENRVHLLGFRSDIVNIMKSTDIFVFPSLQEGLPVALMEAMASGLPCIASKIRGNMDLIENGYTGYLVNVKDENEYKEKIEILIKSDKKELILKEQEMIKNYDAKIISKKMKQIYLG